jgi:predicted permease
MPLYVAIGLGYTWTRLGRRYDTEGITDLVMNVGAPCLVFSSLVGLELDPGAMLEMVLAMLAALACFALVGMVVLRAVGLPYHSFLAPVIFGNTGNMGLPICLFAFGDVGLALGVCVYATNTFVQFTGGLWLWSGGSSPKELLRTPLLYAAALAAIVLATGIAVPVTIVRTTTLLGDFTIPLMSFTLGVTLGRLQIANLRSAALLSLLRIGVGLGVGVGLSTLLGLEGAARGVLILQCSMPIAVINYLLAEKYERQAADVASAIVLSTLISLTTLPLILAWLLPS